MNFVEAELHNDSQCEPDWTPDQEQYYLENPDEWPEPDPGLEPDPDLDEAPNPDHDEHGPIWEEDPEWDDDMVALFDENQGLTAEGYAVLAEMDAMGDFV